MSDNPYQAPPEAANKPLSSRSYGVLAALCALTVPSAAILAGMTCGATFLAADAPITKQIIVSILAGFAVLMFCLLLGSRLGKRSQVDNADYRRAMMRLIVIGIPIGIAAAAAVLCLSLIVLTQIHEGGFAVGLFLAGIAGFAALSIAFWTGLRGPRATTR